jgi:myosin-crossreactive antigen
MLRSNGTSIYWGALALSDIPIISIIVDCGTLGSSSTTAEQVISKSVSDSRITSNMTVIHGEFGDPNAFEEKVTCTSSNGSITIATKLYAGKTSTLTLTLSPTS